MVKIPRGSYVNLLFYFSRVNIDLLNHRQDAFRNFYNITAANPAPPRGGGRAPPPHQDQDFTV